MEFSALAGNRRIKDQLSSQMEGRGLSHAYIICGPVAPAGHTLARLLTQAMLCEGPRPPAPAGPAAPVRRFCGASTQMRR